MVGGIKLSLFKIFCTQSDIPTFYVEKHKSLIHPWGLYFESSPLLSVIYLLGFEGEVPCSVMEHHGRDYSIEFSGLDILVA